MFSRAAKIPLKLPLLLVMLVFLVLLLPESPAVGRAAANDCNYSSWEQYCLPMYYSCLEWNDPDTCCIGGNFCARQLGADCPLFCLEH